MCERSCVRESIGEERKRREKERERESKEEGVKEKGGREGERNEDRTKGGGQRRNRYEYGLTIHLLPDMNKIFHPKHFKNIKYKKSENKYNNMNKSINEKSRLENLTLPFRIINLTD